MRAGRPAFVEEDLHQVDTGDVRRREGVRSLAVIPVAARGTVVACLNVASRVRDHVPATARLALEGVGSRIGAAVRRAIVSAYPRSITRRT